MLSYNIRCFRFRDSGARRSKYFTGVGSFAAIIFVQCFHTNQKTEADLFDLVSHQLYILLSCQYLSGICDDDHIQHAF